MYFLDCSHHIRVVLSGRDLRLQVTDFMPRDDRGRVVRGMPLIRVGRGTPWMQPQQLRYESSSSIIIIATGKGSREGIGPCWGWRNCHHRAVVAILRCHRSRPLHRALYRGQLKLVIGRYIDRSRFRLLLLVSPHATRIEGDQGGVWEVAGVALGVCLAQRCNLYSGRVAVAVNGVDDDEDRSSTISSVEFTS